MPSSERPFSKWDPAATTQEDPSSIEQKERTRRRQHGPDRPGGSLRIKMWLLRSAWIVSTGMLVFGALLMILILAGKGHIIGL